MIDTTTRYFVIGDQSKYGPFERREQAGRLACSLAEHMSETFFVAESIASAVSDFGSSGIVMMSHDEFRKRPVE